jgi:hypothetical protein
MYNCSIANIANPNRKVVGMENWKNYNYMDLIT